MIYSLFFKIAVERDFNPIKGHKTKVQHFFQCKFPLWGSFVILFVLCTLGVICIGVHGGIKSYLNDLENDPFASAIRIEGSYTRSQLNELKDKLYFNPIDGNFATEPANKKEYIQVFEAVYPFNIISIWFLDSSGKKIIPEPYEIFSVKIHNSKSKENKADKFIDKWIKKKLPDGTNYFTSSCQVGMILSKSLFKRLGFSENTKINNQLIHFIDMSQSHNLIEDRLAKGQNIEADVNENEKITDIISIPLVNVAEHLPGGNAIITEGMFFNLTKKDYFNPCKLMEHFYIKKKNNTISENENTTIHKWIRQFFDFMFIENIYEFPDKTSIKLQFSSMPYDKKQRKQYRKITSKCEIRIKFNELNKKLNNQFEIEFYDNIPTYYDETDDYYNAFLYINRNSKLLDKIKDLTTLLKNTIHGNIIDHQAMTLRKYQHDMHKLNWIAGGMIISIGFLILLYISISFTLLLQTKMHKIGLMIAMGAASQSIRFIYLYESFLVMIRPLICSFIFGPLICWLLENILTNFSYSFNLIFIIFYGIALLLIAIIGAWAATNHIVKQWPFSLISYKS